MCQLQQLPHREGIRRQLKSVDDTVDTDNSIWKPGCSEKPPVFNNFLFRNPVSDIFRCPNFRPEFQF